MKMNKKGFALVEILIAITILSIVLLSVFTGVSASVNALAGSKKYTMAMIIAKSKLNDFLLNKKRGVDISKEPIQEYPDFYYTRLTERYENELLEMLGPLYTVKKTDIIISWKEKNKDLEFRLSFIYPLR